MSIVWDKTSIRYQRNQSGTTGQQLTIGFFQSVSALWIWLLWASLWPRRWDHFVFAALLHFNEVLLCMTSNLGRHFSIWLQAYTLKMLKIFFGCWYWIDCWWIKILKADYCVCPYCVWSILPGWRFWFWRVLQFSSSLAQTSSMPRRIVGVHHRSSFLSASLSCMACAASAMGWSAAFTTGNDSPKATFDDPFDIEPTPWWKSGFDIWISNSSSFRIGFDHKGKFTINGARCSQRIAKREACTRSYLIIRKWRLLERNCSRLQ